eukprot:133884_1
MTHHPKYTCITFMLWLITASSATGDELNQLIEINDIEFMKCCDQEHAGMILNENVYTCSIFTTTCKAHTIAASRSIIPRLVKHTQYHHVKHTQYHNATTCKAHTIAASRSVIPRHVKHTQYHHTTTCKAHTISPHFDHNACGYIDSFATYINDYAASFLTCALPNNSAHYDTTNGTDCIAMNSSEFRSNTMNKHTRNSHRMEDVLNTKLNYCITHYEPHVDPPPQSRMLLPIEHTTDRYRCVDNADCYGKHNGVYTTTMEASNSQPSTTPHAHFTSTVHSTPRVSFHTPISQSMLFDEVAVSVATSSLAFFATNHAHCITHMPSVLIWFVLLSHRVLVPAQAQAMNGSSFSC